MKKPLLSILVPVYGVERWIERCAVSLFEQDYENIEYIFVDDCTPDGSITILRDVVSRYPDRATQVRVLRHEKNRGLAAARNTAFDAATGEYIRIVDSDDFIPKNSCSLLVNAILSSGTDIVEGGYCSLLPNNQEETHQPTAINEKTLKKRLCWISPSVMWACIINRNYLISHNLRWEEGVNMSEDYMMMSRILLKAKTSNIEGIVYFYDFTQARDYPAMYPDHINQVVRSTIAVWRYYSSTDHFPSYRRSLELALINTLREEHRSKLAGFDIESCYPQVKPYLGRITQLIAFLLRNNSFYTVGDMFFRLWRTILLTF